MKSDSLSKNQKKLSFRPTLNLEFKLPKECSNLGIARALKEGEMLLICEINIFFFTGDNMVLGHSVSPPRAFSEKFEIKELLGKVKIKLFF